MYPKCRGQKLVLNMGSNYIAVAEVIGPFSDETNLCLMYVDMLLLGKPSR